MEAMDARRLRLYELLKPKLDEEPARELVLALGPPAEQLVTKEDLRLTKEDLKHELTGLKHEIVGIEHEIVGLEQRLDARLARLEAVLTRRMVAIMVAWTVAVGSAFAWAGVLLR